MQIPLTIIDVALLSYTQNAENLFWKERMVVTTDLYIGDICHIFLRLIAQRTTPISHFYNQNCLPKF